MRTNGQLTIFLAMSAWLCVMVGHDLWRRRLPNHLMLAGLILAFAVNGIVVLQGHSVHARQWPLDMLLGCVLGLLLLLPLYLLKACAAGDVKLMAVVGAFVGPDIVPMAVLYALAAGGVLALAFMLRRGVARQTLANLQAMSVARQVGSSAGISRTNTATRLPYGVAVAVGAWIATWEAWHLTP